MIDNISQRILEKFIDGTEEEKTLAALVYVIHYDNITESMIKEEFPTFDDTTIHNIIAALYKHSIIYPTDDGYEVCVWSIHYLNRYILLKLHDLGFSEKYLSEVFKGDHTIKKEVSKITNIGSGWTNVTKDLENGVYFIRIKNPNKVYKSTREEVTYVEDIRLADWKDGKWKVKGPFPLIDYSQVMEGNNIKEGMVVSDCRVATDAEIAAWESRFNPSDNYEKLILEVDDKHINDIYDALAVALSSLAYCANYAEDNEAATKISNAYLRISDLQSILNRKGGSVDAMDK